MLADITDRIIAMGYPATYDAEYLFRNGMDETKRYLNSRHGPHFMVFNL